MLVGLDDIVKAAVERAGSEVTQVEVTLDEADVSPTKGKAELRGLNVANPPGFKTDSAFALGGISVALDIGSLTEDTILVHEVVVAGPQVTYELNEQGGSNIDVIRANVENYGKDDSAGGGSAGSGGGSAESGADEEERKLIIENLYIRGGVVRVSAAMLGGDTMDADLPDIHISDIGKDQGGATPEEVTEIVMTALTDRITGFVGTLDLGQIVEGIEELPTALEGLAGGKVEEVMEELDAGDSGDLKSIGKGLKNLLEN